MPEQSENKQPLRFATKLGFDNDFVRKRAYELYVERGMEDGRDIEDWLRAEEEVLAQFKRLAAVAA